MRKRWLSLALACVTALSLALPAAAYSDIPASSPLSAEVRRAVDAGLMKGYDADRFGYGDPMTRIQFVTVLSRMAGAPAQGNSVPPGMQAGSLSPEFRTALAWAAGADIVDTDRPFRPRAAITRREMAEMLVRSLGLKSAAQAAEKSVALPFRDVSAGRGYIAVAYDIGMTRGTGAHTFSPDATATRAQAAAMLLRIHDKTEQETGLTHGFYAISSHSQLGLGEQMDAVSLGWSRMTWDGKTALLSTTSANGNEYCVPQGYETAVNALHRKGARLHLGVYMDTAGGLGELLRSPAGRRQAVEQIQQELTVSYKALGRNPYDGVTIDFEGLRAAQREDFTAFVRELSYGLRGMGRTLYVCVSPVMEGSYYDGYDYHSMGVLTDKVILMAYGYDARSMAGHLGTAYHKTAATAPIDKVYMGLRAAVQEIPAEKLLLGFSVRNTAWKINGQGKLVSDKPLHPDTKTVEKRLNQADTVKGWSRTYQQSWAEYTDEQGDRWFLWYQDGRSVEQAVQTARLLGVTGVSVWRLGEVPHSWESMVQG